MKLTADEQAERVGWSVKNWNRLNFVTATLAEEEHDPRVISYRWTQFIKRLQRFYFPTLRTIRVLQKHPGGHGWHVHALLDRFIPHSILLRVAKECGLGRIDFQMVSRQRRQDVIQYVCRYVTRDLRKRDKSLRHVRLLTAAGHLRCAVRWWRRYVDCKIESPYGRLRASLCGVLETMGISLPRNVVDSPLLFGLAPPAALAEWRRLNPGVAF
jgi:hypothetical protein